MIPLYRDPVFIFRFEEDRLIIPGKVFSHHDTHFRISYAATMRTLERGVEILKDMAKG